MRRALAIVAIAATATAHASGDWVSEDKALHFTAGAGVALLGYSAAAYAWKPSTDAKRLIVGASAAALASAAKELFDHATGLGAASWQDFAWGLVGGAAACALAWMVNAALAMARAEAGAGSR